MKTRQHYRSDNTIDTFINSEVVNNALHSLDTETCWDNFTQLINTTCSHRVIEYAKTLFDKAFPLQEGSHQKATAYLVYYQHVLVSFADGSITGLRNPNQFVTSHGPKSEPSSIVLNHQGSHIEICFDRNGEFGANDLASIDSIQTIENNKLVPRTEQTKPSKQETIRFLNLQTRRTS